MKTEDGFTRTAKVLIGVAVAVAIVLGFVLGGLGVIIDTNEQAEQNFKAIEESKEVDDRQATILRIILAVTGCAEKETDEQCQEKRKKANEQEGRVRLQAVECIVRAIEQGKDKPTVYRQCGIEPV